MEIKTLKKYNKSRLDNILIKHLEVSRDGKIKIITEKHTKTFYVEDIIAIHTADHIICDLQHEYGVNVSKY
jgi:hypothetical protein